MNGDLFFEFVEDLLVRLLEQETNPKLPREFSLDLTGAAKGIRCRGDLRIGSHTVHVFAGSNGEAAWVH